MSLRERKQQRAREQIVEAAFALFAERGFAQVTVSDIAERAEVGRTTFFRYFGDKQEVVFADEQELLDAFATVPIDGPAPSDLRTAVAQLWELTTAIGEVLLGDPRRYADHQRLVRDNPGLRDRSNRKLMRVTDALEAALLTRGTDLELAVLAAEVAMACYRAAQRAAGDDPAALMPAMRRAVDEVTAR